MSREKNRRRSSSMVGRQVFWLILTLLSGQVRAMTLTVCTWGPHIRHSTFSLLALNHVIFTQHVLRDVLALSIIHCSKCCVETEGCVMATFHHSNPAGGDDDAGGGPAPARCRLFGKVLSVEGPDSRENSPGARSFSLSGVTVHASCPSGYELQCGRCLKASSVWQSYGKAKNVCNLDGGQLVMTKTLEDLACVWTFAVSKDINNFWVGADDQDTGEFMWNDGTSLPDISPLWDKAHEEPVMNEAHSNSVFGALGKLRTMQRFKTLSFVCEHHCG